MLERGILTKYKFVCMSTSFNSPDRRSLSSSIISSSLGWGADRAGLSSSDRGGDQEWPTSCSRKAGHQGDKTAWRSFMRPRYMRTLQGKYITSTLVMQCHKTWRMQKNQLVPPHALVITHQTSSPSPHTSWSRSQTSSGTSSHQGWAEPQGGKQMDRNEMKWNSWSFI